MTDPWWWRAACKDVPLDVFFPGPSNGCSYTVARAICAACPVRRECLADAVAGDAEYGMWGGLTPDQRASEATRERLTAQFGVGHGDAKGTVKGFWREYAAGLEPCFECRGAYNTAAREKRAAKREAMTCH